MPAKDAFQPDWETFEKLMLSQFPFLPPAFAKQVAELHAAWFDRDADWIERYVRQVLDRFFPAAYRHANRPFPGAQHLDFQWLETQRSVFVQCKLPEGAGPDDVHFAASSRALRIECLDIREEIPLPCEVDPDRARAKCRNGILEILLPKREESDPFRTIPIDF
jgi:HSP20 family molecular chaperone IbpA